MTSEQYHRCRHLPGSFDIRFARAMQTYEQDDELTVKQAAEILRQAHRYRLQLHGLIKRYTDDPALQQSLRALCRERGA